MALVWFRVGCRSVELLEAGFKAEYGVGCECDTHEGRDLLWLGLEGPRVVGYFGQGMAGLRVGVEGVMEWFDP